MESIQLPLTTVQRGTASRSNRLTDRCDDTENPNHVADLQNYHISCAPAKGNREDLPMSGLNEKVAPVWPSIPHY